MVQRNKQSCKQSKLLSLIDVHSEVWRYQSRREVYVLKGQEKAILTGKPGFEDLVTKKHDMERTLLIVDECHNFEDGHMAKMRAHQKYPSDWVECPPESEYSDEANDFISTKWAHCSSITDWKRRSVTVSLR